MRLYFRGAITRLFMQNLILKSIFRLRVSVLFGITLRQMRSLLKIDWITALNNLHVNDQVKFLTSCILNVFDNFVPNKTAIFKDKDPP